MEPTVAQPQPIAQSTAATNLANRAMLVSVFIRKWGATRKDKDASKQVNDRHGILDQSGGYFKKNLLAKKALEKINKAAGAARTAHYANTLPWNDAGYRILPSANYMDYMAELKRLKAEFEKEVHQFYLNYPQYVDAARVRLNGLFKEADYPHPAEIKTRFVFEVQVTPIPYAGDWRVELGTDEESKIKADIERRVAVQYEAAQRAAWDRLYEAVTAMKDKLAKYNPDGTDRKSKNAFKGSLVENLVKLSTLLPKLNVTGDARLAELAERVGKELCEYDAKHLKKHGKVRQETQEKAAKLADEISDVMGAFMDA